MSRVYRLYHGLFYATLAVCLLTLLVGDRSWMAGVVAFVHQPPTAQVKEVLGLLLPVLLGAWVLCWAWPVYHNVLWHQHRLNALLALTSLIGSLWLADAYMGVAKPRHRRPDLVYDAWQAMRATDPRATVYNLFATLHQPDGASLVLLGGIPDSRTLLCNENGFWVDYQSDRYGFRNPDTVWDQPTADVLLVGDSFTHGMCYNEPATLAGRLRQHGHKVINMGYSGHGPLKELASLKEFYEVGRAGTVVWLYYEGNDLANLYDDYPDERALLSDLKTEWHTPELHRYLTPEYRQHYFDRIRRFGPELEVVREHAFEHLARRKTEFKQRHPEDPTAALSLLNIRVAIKHAFNRPSKAYRPLPQKTRTRLLKRFGQVLAEARGQAEAHGSRMVFVYIPGQPTFERRGPYPLYEQVLAEARQAGLPVVDLYAELSSRMNPLGYYTRHLNTQGYRLAADLIHQATMTTAANQPGRPNE
ncbi:MAG: hypothetical protein KC474_00410 [Cyanobacteria bacterium HKST-UBA04]|nr:hypothetical protein [Cyanobacteria bacterium HKST-UBA04]